MSAIYGNPDGAHAQVIEDSLSEAGHRLTTMAIQCHRFVLAEFNTHRRFSRNSASSRAIPLAKMVKRVRSNPAIPLSFPAEQKGMQGGAELTGWRRLVAVRAWLLASRIACVLALFLGRLGVHKSICNRLLEPFMWHTIVVSSTEWDNFFALRCHPDAQPEIRATAEAMREALAASVPVNMAPGQWHTPYVDAQCSTDIVAKIDTGLVDGTYDDWACAVSSARCARVSYLTHDGTRDVDLDRGLFDRLTSGRPQHDSPLEHVARPAREGEVVEGNFTGWVQYRHDRSTAA